MALVPGLPVLVKLPAGLPCGGHHRVLPRRQPQHIFQGEITLPLLDVLDIPYFIIGRDTTRGPSAMDELCPMDPTVRKSRPWPWFRASRCS